MKTYIYPQDLKAQAKLWVWNLRDILVIGIALLISILGLSQMRLILPLALTLVYAFLTIRLDDMSIMDLIKRSFRFCISTQQLYWWRERKRS